MPSDSKLHSITVETDQGEILLPWQSDTSLFQTLEAAGLPIRGDCGGRAVCGLCRIRLLDKSQPTPTEGETHHLTPAQLESGLRLACQIQAMPGMRVAIEALSKSPEWRPMREDEYFPLPSLPSGSSGKQGYGLAIDLGTTHIRMSLWDAGSQNRLSGRIGLNPQIAHGADVLTRLMVADRSPALASHLSSLVAECIGDAISGMAEEAGLMPEAVSHVYLVGNTAMLSLLSGKNHSLLMDPQHWGEIIDCQPEQTNLLREAWHLKTDVVIRFLPPMGGFVGSDLLAGVIATRLMEGPPGSLLVDFGTNSEMALWDGKLLRITSTAGGPAFEGSGISSGMPAEAGAIYRVAAGPESGFDVSVVGDVPPRGICGAGLVDAMALLRSMGRLDKVGRLKEAGEAGIVLTEEGQAVAVKAQDIDLFQRAKAAIGAGIVWLCREAGLHPAELQRVCVCGAFGRLLDVESAMQIGLLPMVPAERIELDANTALAGCEMLLLEGEGLEQMRDIQAWSHVFNLAEDIAFETLFVENLYVQPIQD